MVLVFLALVLCQVKGLGCHTTYKSDEHSPLLNAGGLFAVRTPKKARFSVSDIFDGGSNCLLDFLYVEFHQKYH